jgi:hypothetical protein
MSSGVVEKKLSSRCIKILRKKITGPQKFVYLCQAEISK